MKLNGDWVDGVIYSRIESPHVLYTRAVKGDWEDKFEYVDTSLNDSRSIQMLPNGVIAECPVPPEFPRPRISPEYISTWDAIKSMFKFTPRSFRPTKDD